MLKLEKNENIEVTIIRIISELCKADVFKVKKLIMQDLGINWFIDLLNSKNAEKVSAGQYCIQVKTKLNFFFNK